MIKNDYETIKDLGKVFTNLIESIFLVNNILNNWDIKDNEKRIILKSYQRTLKSELSVLEEVIKL